MSDLVWAYESIPVSQERVDEIKALRTLFSELDKTLDKGTLKDGRLKAMAKSHLELAAMLVIKSITHYKEPVKKEG